MVTTRPHSGFSLVELLVATTLLLTISAIVTSALLQMTHAQGTIWNRTEMHSGIRGATELLQQEVGQAGRVSVPGVAGKEGVIVLTQKVNAIGGGAPEVRATCDPGDPTLGADAVQVNTAAGIFADPGPPASYELFTTLDGANQEVVKVASYDLGTPSITACFTKEHEIGAVLMPLGAFATGIVPDIGIADPSTTTVLKLYGDVMGDGNMVYVEYTCDYANRNLYRNVMGFQDMVKPAVTNANILLSNIIPNPDGVPCFKYQREQLTVQGTEFTFILDVAVTLTVETQEIDPITRQKQTETKALLNVSPRNVFAGWQMASLGFTDHIQSTPYRVSQLMQ